MFARELDKNKEFQNLEEMKDVLLKVFSEQASFATRDGHGADNERSASLGALATGYCKVIEAQLALQNNLK